MKLNEINHAALGEARITGAKKARDLLLAIFNILIDEGCTTTSDIYELSVTPGPVITLRLMAEEPGDLDELEMLHRVVAKRLARDIPGVKARVHLLGNDDDGGGAEIKLEIDDSLIWHDYHKHKTNILKQIDDRMAWYRDLKHESVILIVELFRHEEDVPLADALEAYRAHGK
jgi:hypothetical protein